jgi:hypothetical protein
MAEDEGAPKKQPWGPGMLLLMTLACLGITIWGVVDGWLREGYEHALFSKGVAVLFAVAAACLAVLTAKRWKVKPGPSGESSPPPPADEG